MLHRSGELIQTLNDLFSRIDELVSAHGLGKIKTIGDSYMIAGRVLDGRVIRPTWSVSPERAIRHKARRSHQTL